MGIERLPVAVIGAGPVGLAAAAHLHERGQPFVVLEAGAQPAAAVRQWGHVRLFSPWSYVVDEAARRLLETWGWASPDAAAYPTGSELVAHYIEPLAAHPAIAAGLRLQARVVAVTRAGADKMKSAGRETLPFQVALQTPDGTQRLLARAVIDASGTWQTPNPLGAAGIPADGELALSDRMAYRIPDVLGAERAAYAGRTTLVVGAGHSAFNTILDLTRLAADVPGTQVTWAVRRPSVATLFGGGAGDALVQRGLLGQRIHDLVSSGAVSLVTDFRATRVEPAGARVRVAGVDADGRDLTLDAVDRIVVNTGFRPDHRITSELRLELDPIVETTPKLAPLIDPNLHSCGTVPPHGAAELTHPEPGFFTVGMKSYGRAPTFLLLTGYEQVRSVVAHLVGDAEAAASVQLDLPETGVCSVSAVLADDRAGLPVAEAAGDGVCCG